MIQGVTSRNSIPPWIIRNSEDILICFHPGSRLHQAAGFPEEAGVRPVISEPASKTEQAGFQAAGTGARVHILVPGSMAAEDGHREAASKWAAGIQAAASKLKAGIQGDII